MLSFVSSPNLTSLDVLNLCSPFAGRNLSFILFPCIKNSTILTSIFTDDNNQNSTFNRKYLESEMALTLFLDVRITPSCRCEFIFVYFLSLSANLLRFFQFSVSLPLPACQSIRLFFFLSPYSIDRMCLPSWFFFFGTFFPSLVSQIKYRFHFNTEKNVTKHTRLQLVTSPEK